MFLLLFDVLLSFIVGFLVVDDFIECDWVWKNWNILLFCLLGISFIVLNEIDCMCEGFVEFLLCRGVLIWNEVGFRFRNLRMFCFGLGEGDIGCEIEDVCKVFNNLLLFVLFFVCKLLKEIVCLK